MLAVLIAAGAAAYLNSLSGVLLFDDMKSIVDNPTIRQLSTAWSNMATERPVVSLSLAANYAIGGLRVRSYHWFNLVVHLLAAISLFGVVLETLRAPRFSGKATGYAPWFAFTVALIWELHPLQTESVTYVIQRAESMMGLFYLLTLYGLIRGARSSRSIAWYAAAVIACALGMATKAVMSTAPILALIYDRVFLSRSFSEAFHRRRGLYLGLFGTWLVLVPTGIAAGILNPVKRAGLTVGLGYQGATPLEYAMTQPGVILHYLKLSFWPHPLCLDYWWPLAKTPAAVAVPLLIIVGLLALTIAAFWRWPSLGFAGASFFLILAPTSSFIPVQDPAFEHRMYLPLASVIVVAAVGFQHLLDRAGQPLGLPAVARRVVVALVVIAIAATFGFATFRRNQYYLSSKAMWGSVVNVRPANPRARSNFGKALGEAGQIDEAIAQLRTALVIMPGYHHAHSNLGNALVAQGKLDEAISHYREAIRLRDDYLEAHNNLGAALAQQGDLEQASVELRWVLEHDPDNVSAVRNLTLVLQNSGKIDDTIQHGMDWIRLQPQSREAQNALATALMRRGDIDGAIRHYGNHALFGPAYAQAYVLAAEHSRSLGNEAGARIAYTKALSVDASNAAARSALKALGAPGTAGR